MARRPRGQSHTSPVLRELRIGFVPYSPLGHGFLAGTIRSPDDLDDTDWRKTNPRFTGENFQHNLAIADEVGTIAAEAGATSAQVTLAWLLAKATTSHRSRAPSTSAGWKNVAADTIQLTPQQIARLDNPAQVTGGPLL